MDVTPDQMRAARALLRLDQAELGHRAQLSVITIRRIEGAAGHVAPGAIQSVRQVLEQGGAEFIPGGVRRRDAATDSRGRFEELRAISLRSAALLQGHERLEESDLYDEDGLPA